MIVDSQTWGIEKVNILNIYINLEAWVGTADFCTTLNRSIYKYYIEICGR